MKTRILIAAIVFFLAMTACRGTFQIGLENNTPTPAGIGSTATPAATLLPPATATPILTNPTPQATVTSTSPAVNIVMAAGTTAGVMQGTVQPGQVLSYTLSAGQAQPMILIVKSPNNDVTLAVFEPNGNALLNPVNKWTQWQGVLPRTEQYTIQVIGGATTESYTLTAKVAQLVSFSPGTSSASLSGSTTKGYVFSYGLGGGAGQTMTVTLNTPSSTAYIDIFGVASGSVLSSVARATTWTGVLPQTQDYVIEVIPNNGQVVNYGLMVSVGPTAGNINMTAGTTAGVVQGTVQPGQVLTYTLEAGQSQPMILIVNSPNTDVTLGVFEPNGNELLNPANKWTRWQGLLPETELYKIQVIGGATTENYTLTVKVPQLVNFAAGTISTSLIGSTVSGYVFSYAIQASANQTMTVSLNVPSTTAYLDIFGLASGTILSSSAKATSWTGTLPQAQDYVIEVIPNNGAVVGYGLTVTVH
jgi:hypothetical protein